jgi:hypothetical protein
LKLIPGIKHFYTFFAPHGKFLYFFLPRRENFYTFFAPQGKKTFILFSRFFPSFGQLKRETGKTGKKSGKTGKRETATTLVYSKYIYRVAIDLQAKKRAPSQK